MPNQKKRVRVTAEPRPTKDLERFADALLGWALHQLRKNQATEPETTAAAELNSREEHAS
jgi:hypothetical protein